jgi:hypothetical protein
MEEITLQEQEMNSLFEKAMQIVEDAFFLQRDGKQSEAVGKYETAFNMVKQVADYLIGLPEPLEPSRSEVTRNAAQLALDCGKMEDARKYANLLIEWNYDLEYVEEANIIIKTSNI